ncbi:murein hydrolase activator EnvC family protein [Hephaestia sp. GCM10023244]|uniref:murein hydrolase activator EnvC family protein n=1 Tax=unclassified Hephaestia TaxID=2631281 RepID=UPI0020778EFF|nr:peptidoglycan DD-metalloendopeptidase family protein [Hephaestia sp. MAHUQ-44]MCM8731113.1 peptidoglycan DD-metalloendopeptidase family protein [Hephaestia sp. MAHUQ-44]
MRGWVIATIGVAGAALAAPVGVAPATDLQAQRLADARRASAAAEQRSQRLDAEAAAQRDAAAKARTEQAATVARLQAAEADIAAAEARSAIVGAALDRQRARLAARQGPVVRLLAALQSMASRPAIIAVAQPGSVDDMVHIRAVLGSVTPVIHARTATVRRDLADLRALEADAATALTALEGARARLDDRRLALARLEATHRARARTLGRDALAASDQAIALGERARALVDLMDQAQDDAVTRAALAALPAPEARPLRPGEVASTLDGSPWTAADAPYRLPVAGRLVTGFGAMSAAGVRSRGLTIDPADGAPVIAPAAGTVAFARTFRDYGPIVIIDHGAGWTTLVAGLGVLSVRPGDVVAQGDAIGHAGTMRDGAAPRVTVELRRKGRPINITPLLG